MKRRGRTTSTSCLSAIVGAVIVVLGTRCVDAAPPSTTAVDWPSRIDAALRDTGSVAAVAKALSAEPDDAPGVWQARARVAEESGDLPVALRVLEPAARAKPGDPAVLAALADVQDQLGRVGAAVETLRRCVAVAGDDSDKDAATLKLAVLLLDTGRPDEAERLLDRAVVDRPALAVRAAMACVLLGRPAAANRYFAATTDDAVPLLLLRGEAALQAGDTTNAAGLFDRVLAKAGPADRRYALTRRIAAARQAGTLAALTSAWLADPHLPPERRLPLAVALRELGRVDELLAWWRSTARAPAADEDANRLATEVLGAARSAGRTQEVLAVCRAELDRSPSDGPWLLVTLHALLDLGRTENADVLLRERLSAAGSAPDAVKAVARLARSVGRDGVARAAADRLVGLGGEAAIAGELLAADIDASSGNPDAAVRLNAAAAAAPLHPATLGRVAGALEAAAMNDRAIDTLRAAPPDADTLSRLATLLSRAHRPAEAADVLRRLTRVPASPAVHAQAAADWLDAAGEAGTVPELLREVRARLDGGSGNEEDLTLFANACLRQHDVPAAVALIEQSKFLDEPARLRHLLFVYQRAGDLDAAAGVLRRLVEADPADADRTLERLAGVELKRGRTTEAGEAVERLRARVGDGPAALSLMAGVYSRLGRPRDAADAFRRAVAQRPADADGWLLWAGAAAKAGDATAARRRLQTLCADATDESIVAAAVDGLLSLSADPAALRAARRAVVCRLAERPQSLLLYQVVADLCSELDDTPGLVRATTAAVAVDADGRAQKLRELVDVAAAHGDLQSAIASGRSLLTLGDALPPGLFLQLGEQLLIAGRPVDAAAAFERAAESGDPADTGLRAAGLLENYEYFADALRVLKPLVGRGKPEAATFEQVARLQEINGHADRAFAGYLSALSLTAVQVASAPAGAEATGGALSRQVAGALVSTRSKADEERVLTTLDGLLRAAVARSPTAAVRVPADASAWLKALRQAATYFGRPERANLAADLISSRWPDAEVPDRRSAAAGVNALPALIIRGETGPARAELIRLLDGPATRPDAAQPAPVAFGTLLRAAAALGDAALTNTVAARWADAALARSDANDLRGECLDCVKTSWPNLDTDGRRQLVDRLVRASGEASHPNTRSFLAVTVLPLARAIDWPGDTLGLAERATGPGAAQGPPNRTIAARVFVMLPDANRPAYLRAVSAALPEQQRLAWLMDVLDVTSDPPDEATSVTMIELAEHVPPGQRTPWGTWFSNDRRPDVLRAVAEAALRSAGQDDPDGLTRWEKQAAVAAALRNAGEKDAADRLARSAIDGLKDVATTESTRPRSPSLPDRLPVLRVAIAALSTGARKDLLATSQTCPSEAAPASRAALRSLVLDGLGERAEALRVARAAWEREPTDPLLLRMYQERLAEDGRLAETLTLRTTTSSATADRFAVAGQLQELYRWREARAAFAAGANAPDFAGPAASGDSAALARAWRAFLQDARARPDQLPQIHLPDQRGLSDGQPHDERGPPQLIEQIGRWPGARDDLLRTLHLPIADGTDELSTYLSRALVQSARSAGADERLIERFRRLTVSGTLSAGDRCAITLLAREPGVTVPADLLDKLWPAALADDSGRELDALARALAAQHLSPAAEAWTRTRPITQRAAAGVEADASDTTPLDLLPDAASAAALCRIADGNLNDAVVRLAAIQRAGQLRKKAFRLRLVRARVAAERGDIDAYRAHLRDTLDDWAWQAASPEASVTFDSSEGSLELTLALPTHVTDSRQGAAVLASTLACLTEAASRWPALTEFTRQAASVGAYALRQGDRSACEEWLKAADDLGRQQGAGEHRLWVADLAGQLGQQSLADATEADLLNERCLPADRIAPLLVRLVEQGQWSRARRLGSDACTYCWEPKLRIIALLLGSDQVYVR